MRTIIAKKSLGQNFLINQEALSNIAGAIEITGKHIIEIGPGYGALTDYIVGAGPASLDLVELDKDMLPILKERFRVAENTANRKNEQCMQTIHTPLKTVDVTRGKEDFMPKNNITIHHQDILTFIPQYNDYSVIANIPYYITSPILFHFLYPAIKPSITKLSSTQNFHNSLYHNQIGTQHSHIPSFHITQAFTFQSPHEMVIMMQKEVGEKILAGQKKKPYHSYLSLAMELACEKIEIVRYVGREHFNPIPKVDSIVLKFTVKKSRDRTQEEKFLTLWKVAFTHPRKTLISNLKNSHYDIKVVKKWINACGYDEKIRAESIEMENWKNLIDKFFI